MSRETSWMDSGACPPEWVLSVYVDDACGAEETRALETHLVGCRACREAVVALEEEVAVLRTALRVEEAELSGEAAPVSPRSLAMGMGSAVTTAGVCLVAVGWLGQLAIPPLLEWLNPLGTSGAYSMILDTVFSLRKDAPATYQFVVSAAALLSVAFLLTTTFTLSTRRWLQRETAGWLITASLGAIAVSPASPARAVELVFDAEEVALPAGEVVEETWIASADTVLVEGTLRGDLIVFADRVEISGAVDGNVLSGTRKLEISGEVTGSVAVFGDRVRIGGQIDRNLYAVSEQTTLTEAGAVGGDLFTAGEGVLVAGTVGRGAMTVGEWIEVPGSIARDLSTRAEHAEIGPHARIGGDLRIRYSDDEDDIEVDPRASVGGETTIEPSDSKPDDEMSRYGSGHFYAFLLVSFAAAFAAGMILFRAAPWLFQARVQDSSDLFRVLGYGFLTLVAIPIACVVIALTVIGIPLALLGAALFAFSIYFADILIGGMIGMTLVGAPEEDDWAGFGLPLLTGLAIVFVAAALPWIGGVIGFVFLLAGLGVIVAQTQERLRL